jgi:hypothetical protein
MGRMQIIQEIKQCKCGGTPKLMLSCGGFDIYYKVQCEQCKSTALFEWDDHISAWLNENEAIEAWNDKQDKLKG